MRGVAADREALAVERVHPGRRRGPGAVRDRARRVDVEAPAARRRDVRRDVEAGRPAPVVGPVAVAVEVAAREGDGDVAGRPVRGVDGVVLLAGGDELGAGVLRVQVVGQLGVALVGDQQVELVARERARDPHRVLAGAEHVVAVAERLVGPAHVLRELAAGDHVVGDHGLGRHVAEIGVLEVHAVAHQRAHVAHVELVDEVRPELVQHDDQHPLGLLRLPVPPGRGRDAQQDQQSNNRAQAKRRMDPSSGGPDPDSLPAVVRGASRFDVVNTRASMLRDAAGGNLCGACRAGPGDGFGCGRARAAGRRRRARRGVVREDHGARARRPALRRRAGRAAAGDQERRAALDAVPDRAPSTSDGERGLLGIAFDPDFATNRFVYVYYTATSPVVHNRVSRFTASAADVAGRPGSEQVIVDSTSRRSAGNHNGGALHFGPTASSTSPSARTHSGRNAQSLSSNLLGQDPAASTPTARSRPTTRSTTRDRHNRAIWALGLRNPFTFAVQPRHGPDLHQRRRRRTRCEEINEGVAGANYGWPDDRGRRRPTRASTAPFYAYARTRRRPAAPSPAARSTTRATAHVPRASTSATTSSPTTAAAGSSGSTRRPTASSRLRDRDRAAGRPRRRPGRQPLLPRARRRAGTRAAASPTPAAQAPSITHAPASQ